MEAGGSDLPLNHLPLIVGSITCLIQLVCQDDKQLDATKKKKKRLRQLQDDVNRFSVPV